MNCNANNQKDKTNSKTQKIMIKNLMAMMSLTTNTLIKKEKYTGQTVTEKQYKIKKAELRREYKKLKKEGNIEKAKNIKLQYDNLKL